MTRFVRNQSGDTSILLDSRAGHALDNLQAWSLTTLDWATATDLSKRFPDERFAEFLSAPCPVYNCHGLTFASRRTQIEPKSTSFPQLLLDDGYVEVDMNNVNTGDIVLYYDDDGDIDHSGIVVGVRQLEPSGQRIPWVWSKWGHFQEVRHHFANCPFPSHNCRFYRMKKWERSRNH